jgi:hypothetical protein
LTRYLAIAALAVCSVLALAQDATPPKPVVSITVIVLNGKTGRPVWRESPNIWIDKEPSINPYTNWRGKARIKVPRDAAQLRITPDFGHDCRWKEDEANTTRTASYSIADILQTGIVSENICGAAKVTPQPGVLVFYELPSTWRERWYN